MDRQAITEELKIIIDDYLRQQGLELVGLVYRQEGRDFALRILTDRPQGGINLDDCAYLNKEIGILLDEKNILQDRYILEISSPGLDRRLKTKNDFLRCLNRRVRFLLNEKIEGKMEFDGDVTGVTDLSVYINIEERKIEIPFSKITKAEQVV